MNSSTCEIIRRSVRGNDHFEKTFNFDILGQFCYVIIILSTPIQNLDPLYNFIF